MSRLFFVPQLPVSMRYSSWWFTEIKKSMKKYFDEVIVLGDSVVGQMERLSDEGLFAPIKLAINFECSQIADFQNYEIQDDDVLFLADLSFPGIFTNVLFHKRVKNAYAFCHATSLNAYDYFQPVRRTKWPVERDHGRLFKKVFVGSNYHWHKLVNRGWKENNIELLRLPLPPHKMFPGLKKKHEVVSVSRPSIQKVNKKLERAVEKELGIKIIHAHEVLEGNKSWNRYFRFLGESSVSLTTSHEETFGYQVTDAVMNNCIPIAPNRCSYPELLEDEYLYRSHDECIDKVIQALNSHGIPQIKTRVMEECLNFYNNLAYELMGENNHVD